MFEKFTDRARKVILLARQEAERSGHAYYGPEAFIATQRSIGTEHILLALAEEGSGVAAVVLGDLRVTPERLRAAAGWRPRDSVNEESDITSGLPFTPKAKKALEFASEAAGFLEHCYVGTEHLLLGLLKVQDGNANRLLEHLGVLPEAIRRGVLSVLDVEPAKLLPRRVPPAESLARHLMDHLVDLAERRDASIRTEESRPVGPPNEIVDLIRLYIALAHPLDNQRTDERPERLRTFLADMRQLLDKHGPLIRWD